jgi:hypothetical protein
MNSPQPLPNPDGFQDGGNAWDPSRPDLLDLLRRSRHAAIRPIYYGSNHTFLVTLDGGEVGESYAVYKPSRGEYPLYDFPPGSLYRREIATYLVSSLLGWDLVPATVETTGRYGPGSLQLFVESLSSGEIAVSELRRVALLDVVVNNADRKGEHCLLGHGGKLWAIDHGLTFHPQPKLRTVLWHFSGEPIPSPELDALGQLRSDLRNPRERQSRDLKRLVSTIEWRALALRVERLITAERFPDPRYKPVPYRW